MNRNYKCPKCGLEGFFEDGNEPDVKVTSGTVLTNREKIAAEGYDGFLQLLSDVADKGMACFYGYCQKEICPYFQEDCEMTCPVPNTTIIEWWLEQPADVRKKPYVKPGYEVIE